MARPSYVILTAGASRIVFVNVTKDPDVAASTHRIEGRSIVFAEEYGTAVEANRRVGELMEQSQNSLAALVTEHNLEWSDWFVRSGPVPAGGGWTAKGEDPPDASGGVPARVPTAPRDPLAGANAKAM